MERKLLEVLIYVHYGEVSYGRTGELSTEDPGRGKKGREIRLILSHLIQRL